MKRIFAIVLTLALAAALAAPALAAEFTDVPASHTFHDAIAACSASGIVGGYSDGTFRPGNTVTKSNFTVMLSRAFFAGDIAKRDNAYNREIYGPFGPNYLAVSYGGAFEGASFYEDFVMLRLGIMNTSINRYDMAQLIANILKSKGIAVSDAEKSAAASKISDYSSIPADYRDAVASAAAKGLIGGYSDGNFHGDRTMNRGQAAVVIYRLQALVPAQTPEPAPDTTPDPAASQTSADVPAGFLTNGKPITEENVTEILNQLQERYPGKTDFRKGYGGLGSGRSPWYNCIQQITDQYETSDNGWLNGKRKTTKGGKVSTFSGCGGWAAFVADELFGQTNVTWKKTTIENARPGDLLIDLDSAGYLKHVHICTGEIDGIPKAIGVNSTDAGANSSGVYHISWGTYSFGALDDPNRIYVDVYTAYPD